MAKSKQNTKFRKSVLIEEEQEKFLREEQGFNFSGFVRKSLYEEMKKRGYDPK
ncbi:hypothetical protein C497_00090 [Halalkalicoccus jeotgali B3]|uniref:Uncharacterized protein n=1 Tax=Halalkalicoccus jeotgali (strain DSM 18796 / CECT 7217 / JCM 14584 / KCTC 4019 / B3) TaxID=795797 RepID=D8JD90_HALJB|nr:hypothetical protein HacjB3_19538 [Halalkalicoccus jeotgali B3]ELY41954.1 hypothetical protein C497_00090 [Halalkalicoccus jeotgali B3]